MRKYIGTSTTSKNTKNKMRSSARNTPMRAASSSSIQAMKDLDRWMSADASSPIGMSSAVNATMNRLMPSTPTVHRTPSGSIHA